MSGEHGEPWRHDGVQWMNRHGRRMEGGADTINRIVACVNALDGVTTEAIEAGAVTKLVASLEACRDALAINASGKFKLECLNGAREALKPFSEIARD